MPQIVSNWLLILADVSAVVFHQISHILQDDVIRAIDFISIVLNTN